ncbi:hypothetical protein [Arenibacter sp. GZD-96]|uniref:hypothetical protein n=1 Tax=Aurantibrevibacter litoralis TaxID=3106030 RepID=UPI002AFF8518|nr:hypothetical protein [Arenibacter sp. GZD-96]
MAQKKYNAFEHASHNLRAHNFVKQSGEFPDWEITTAFYSCLKFFEGSLFPETYLHPGKEDTGEKREFQSYNEYKQVFSRFCQGTPHDIMKRFVKHNTNLHIWNSYNDLYDLCHNSRYKNYQIDPRDLQITKSSLEAIRLYCTINLK